MTSFNQMIEEDLFFPGKRVDRDDDDKSSYGRDDTSSMMTRQGSTSSEPQRTSFSINGHDETDRETLRLGNVSEQGELASGNENSSSRQDAPSTPKTRSTLLGTTEDGAAPTASRPSSPVHSAMGGASVNGHRIGGGGSYDANDTHGSAKPTGGGRHHTQAQVIHPATTPPLSASPPSAAHAFVAPSGRSTKRPALLVKTPMRASEAHAELLFGSSASLLGSMGYLAYQDPLADALRRQRKLEAAAKKNHAPLQGSQRTRPSPFLSTLMNKGPVNPRDHTILQAVWDGMLEGRFVNGSPLSLLTTYLEYHFKGAACSIQ